MKILLAPDSFKDSLTSAEVCYALEEGITRYNPNIECIHKPMADGGEGTMDTLVNATNGRIVETQVKDPLMRNIKAKFGILGDQKTAIIEMAKASGIELLTPPERNPWITSTFGTGQLILAALDQGCKTIILGIGGSATNDGGAGMFQALGARLTGNAGNVENGGGALNTITEIDVTSLDQRLRTIDIKIACDVTNQLTGEQGASKVYGPQKGANTSMVKALDENLKHWGNLISQKSQKDVITLEGGGAAGGIAVPLFAFLDAELHPGFTLISEATKLQEAIEVCDWVITGEGKIDHQTIYGKVPVGVAKLAKQKNKFVMAIAGTLGDGYRDLYQEGIDSILSIIDKPMTLEEALTNADKLLSNMGEAIIRIYERGHQP